MSHIEFKLLVKTFFFVSNTVPSRTIKGAPNLRQCAAVMTKFELINVPPHLN